MNCDLDHIPERLHQNNNPLIENFSIGEFLYRRCDKEDLSNPYLKISLTELSHNRSLNGNNRSYPNDVLFDIKKDNNTKIIPDKVVCNLIIKSLNDDYKYIKKFEETKTNIVYNAVLCLLHQPEPCMYHHCVFRIILDGVIITYDNYKTTLNKLNKIKTAIKTEIASMIYTGEIDQNREIEYNL
ncbi:MAG: hypothetical protein PHC28_10810 [Flavobacterium sp.]|uniref:hypothetical protein n=1 Tax=Flavobacterium sp. TaxID=239 RepID=UPI00262F5DFF|nr:hypothetical protein [Flavobacterium sp.]MDD5150946.1 hypothetical protein [Flavobacterium sp.]